MSDHVVSENVYEALGFSDHKAMATKAHLAMQIADQIKARGLSGVQAAKVMGLTQPKLSGLLRGQFQAISERKMMDCLTALGNDVDIVIRKARTRIGKIAVVQRPVKARRIARAKQAA